MTPRKTGTTAAVVDAPMTGREAETYQRLREHLDTLRLAAAAALSTTRFPL